MKGFLRKWNEISLIKRIVCGLAMGAVLALLLPDIYVIGLLGTLFVGALKAIAPLLVFFPGHCVSGAGESGAGNMSRVVGLYLIGTFLAALTAVAASFLFPVNITLAAAAAGYEAASGIGAVLESLLMKVVENPVGALINANYIGILAWAAVFGVALRRAGEATKELFGHIADALTQVVRWIIACAPSVFWDLCTVRCRKMGLGSLQSMAGCCCFWWAVCCSLLWWSIR